MLDEVDEDGSGEIDFDEFKKMMESLKNKSKITDQRIIFPFGISGNHWTLTSNRFAVNGLSQTSRSVSRTKEIRVE